MKSTILRGQRVTLRPIKLSDAPIFVRWFNDREVVKYLLTINQNGTTLAGENKYIRRIQRAKDKQVRLIVNEDGKPIGNTSITIFPEDKRVRFGLVIGDKSQWGKGYAGECIKVIGDYVFNELKYNRFELEVYMKNDRAVHAYKKAGFVLEGVRRQCRWNKITKEWDDEVIMSILRGEWVDKK